MATASPASMSATRKLELPSSLALKTSTSGSRAPIAAYYRPVSSAWRKGRRARFRIWCPKGRGGSNPLADSSSRPQLFNARFVIPHCMALGGLGPGETWIGRELGNYHLLRILGSGGMGIVFEAEHRLLNRRVAIKTIRPHVANDHTFSRRFLLEARAIAALDHPGIVGLHDFAFEGATPYMVMEFVTGQTLEDVMAVGRLAAPGLVRLLQPVAEALDHAHTHGIVHRDVKPGNILLADDGRTLVMDFGLACLDGFTMATDPESFLGTPDYISPEQVAGQSVDGRADIYSLAAVIYEAVSGCKPFVGKNWIEIASRRLLEPPPRVS